MTTPTTTSGLSSLDTYSPSMAQAVASNLEKMPPHELEAMLPAMRHRGGNGLVLLEAELERRTQASTAVQVLVHRTGRSLC